MKTQPLYLTDSYIKEVDAVIIDIQPDGENKYRLLLDKTIFYPMGGGQPTDQGKLSSPTWSGDVYQVIMKDGEIWHYVKASSAPIPNLSVHAAINWERRYKNMRTHSAGHVIDFALYKLGYSPQPLTPIKGDHGKKAFILYQGVLGKDIKDELSAKANELVQKKLEFTWTFQPFEDLKKEAIYLQPGLPTNKPLRTLRLDTIGAVADGGTQVKNTAEIGQITITSISEREGNTIISYQIS